MQNSHQNVDQNESSDEFEFLTVEGVSFEDQIDKEIQK